MKKAFTIVELLVVMAVIGILITLAVVGIQAIQKSQRETVRANDLRNITSLLETYYSKHRQYPTGNAATGTVLAVCDAGGEFGYDTATATVAFCNPTEATPSPNYRVVLQSLGGVVKTGNTAALTDFSCTATGGANGILEGNADVWTILYKTATSTPQSYTLAGCTENGLTANFGTY